MASWRDKDEFKARVVRWAEKLDVEVRAVAVRPMVTKWASCSTAGNLNFNSDLLALSKEIGDYVIVHELLHFFVPNHGPLWKSLMRAHLGEYEHAAEALLRATSRAANAVPFDKAALPTRNLRGRRGAVNTRLG